MEWGISSRFVPLFVDPTNDEITVGVICAVAIDERAQ
jgi:hypothetical protein